MKTQILLSNASINGIQDQSVIRSAEKYKIEDEDEKEIDKEDEKKNEEVRKKIGEGKEASARGIAAERKEKEVKDEMQRVRMNGRKKTRMMTCVIVTLVVDDLLLF